MNKKEKTEKTELIDLLQNLVGMVLNDDMAGGCVWCRGSGKEGAYGYCDSSYDCHAVDCAWVEGDKFLRELQSS